MIQDQAINDAVAIAVAKRIAQLQIDLEENQPAVQNYREMADPQRVYEVQNPEFPWMPELTFGLERIAANKINVLNCKARRYGDPQGSSIYYVCDDKEITFAGDGTGQRICWKWNPTDGLRILDNAQTGDPMDDSTDVYGVVAIFDVSGGVATLATGGIIQCGQVLTLPVFTV